MSTITEKDYGKIKEPCRSCYTGLSATGRGNNKVFYCKAASAKLMGGGNLDWFEIPDCPKHTKSGWYNEISDKR
jgi:hypothetical protein